MKYEKTITNNLHKSINFESDVVNKTEPNVARMLGKSRVKNVRRDWSGFYT